MSKVESNDKYQEEYTEDFAANWDALINWEGRDEGERGFFERLLKVYEVKTVADVACGTGYHAINLAQQGFEVTATDGSANMIEQTNRNAEEHKAKLAESRVVDWLELKNTYPENHFDALICLGNAFTHLFDHETRRDALESMVQVVKPGGLVIMDHRNYDDMLDNGFNNKHQYYYTGHGVDAYPIELSRTKARFEYAFPDGKKFYLTMYPLKQNYMSFLLEDAGLMDITRYGDFERPYEHYAPDFIQQVGFKPRAD